MLFERRAIVERIPTYFTVISWLFLGVEFRVRFQSLFSCESDTAVLTNKRLAWVSDWEPFNKFTHSLRRLQVFVVIFMIAECDVQVDRQFLVLHQLLKLWRRFFDRLFLSDNFRWLNGSRRSCRLCVVVVIEIIIIRDVIIRVI